MEGKPLGRKSYGHVPHLPGSRMGPADKHCEPRQGEIATEKARDENDLIIVQEKIDGSNVGVAKVNGEILALNRAGHLAVTSPHENHQIFAAWIAKPPQQQRFKALLKERERICGEWLLQAHGTIYKLPHEPFVAFDLMTEDKHLPFEEAKQRIISHDITYVNTIHVGHPISVEKALKLLGRGAHGAQEEVEGAIWRVERLFESKENKALRKYRHDFMVKFVKADKLDGKYMPKETGKAAIWNEYLGERIVHPE